ncbi:MAG: peptidoglycan recognition family protein [Lawsonibacter sp.]|nr:peptidoglycan recognition family protein [Lawsonibacter sp.]
MNLYTCLLTANDCYKAGKNIVPRGVMIHSTGANNSRLSRYVAPNDGLLGEPALRHWNQSGVGACPHAFIGKLNNGSVATYQTLPWTMRGWHCGRAANNTHISFEICEDGLADAEYFAAVYQEAVELTAYLCKTYGLGPLADGVVICHQEGYQRGIASNHGDVLHWFPKHGKSMYDFRADVAQELGDNMDEAKIRAIVREEVAAAETERAKMPASSWAKPLIAEAKALKITESGERPMSMVTREESIAMALAAYKAAKR